jgi:hypothetical protein
MPEIEARTGGCPSKTYYVLDRLIIGKTPTHLTGLFVPTDRPDCALRVFRKGATPVVPTFEVAEEFLRLAGWTEEAITSQIQMTRGDVEWDGRSGLVPPPA